MTSLLFILFFICKEYFMCFVWTCEHVYMGFCACDCLLRLEVDIECLSLLLSTLFFGKGLSLNLELIDWVDWFVSEFQGAAYLPFGASPHWLKDALHNCGSKLGSSCLQGRFFTDSVFSLAPSGSYFKSCMRKDWREISRGVLGWRNSFHFAYWEKSR